MEIAGDDAVADIVVLIEFSQAPQHDLKSTRAVRGMWTN